MRAGAAAWYQDRVFQNLNSKRLQIDELWGFIHAKQKNVPAAKKAPAFAGDVWLWVATDADTKLVPSSYVGGRGSDAAIVLMDDLVSKVSPAMAAGVSKRLWEMKDVVTMLEAWEAASR
jgi:hypothetical protein